MVIRTDNPTDHAAIRAVNALAFGQDAEGRLVDALREGGYVRLSLVAEAKGVIVGHVLFSELPISSPEGIVRALALAPMCVAPDHHRQGIGTALIEEGLRHCRELSHRIVVVLGHVDYYSRFGFSVTLAEPLRCAYSGPALMAMELAVGSLNGVKGELLYPPPFQSA